MAEEKIPQPTFSRGLGNFYFNIKYDDSMIMIIDVINLFSIAEIGEIANVQSNSLEIA